MKACVIRVEGMAEERIAVLRRLTEVRVDPLVEEVREIVVGEEDLLHSEYTDNVIASLDGVRVLFVAVPGAYATHIAKSALRQGMHTFLGRSAAPSIAECQSIAALSEEAGVEAGISRIMRFHPFLSALPENWRANALTVRHERQRWDLKQFRQMMEDAVDLCCNLAGTGDVRKIEAQQIQNQQKLPGSLMIGFRFQNGTYAQIQLRHGVLESRYEVYAGGSSMEFEMNLLNNTLHVRNTSAGENDKGKFAFESQSLPNCDLIEQETITFLDSIASQKSVPVSIMEGLQTLQLIEGIRRALR